MTPLIGFIMLPIYTQYLSPDEYAIMTTVQTLVGMLEVFIILSLKSALTRFYYDFLEDLKKQKEYLGSIFMFVFLFSTVLSLISLFLYKPIGSLLFNSIPIKPYYFYLIILAWISGLFSLPMALYRAQEKAGTFVSANVIKAFFTMLLTGYLIVGEGMGAESALLSQITISFIVTAIVYIFQLKNIKLNWNKTFIKESLLFSLPMIPHVASGWIISSSDRVILEKFISLDNLGVYSLAAQVSMVLAIFYTSVNNAFVPRYTRLRKEGQETDGNKLLKVFLMVILIFGLVSIPISMFAVRVITSEEYYGAIILLPALLIGHMIKGFYYMPVAKLVYAKKTGAIARSSTIAAVVNIIINFVVIPYIGVYGAIVSTIMAELVRYLLISRASRIYSSVNSFASKI
ncbi:oligosaccharide flippase family protein [Lentibacillus halophilus]|uniref:Oligosaccharide flippase family protein n=2 Tax=Lentibacillus halophilus TaxID=295065 RepID=A0ABP3IVG3_9BACI